MLLAVLVCLVDIAECKASAKQQAGARNSDQAAIFLLAPSTLSGILL